MVETYKKFAPRGYEMIAVAMSYDHPNQVAEFAATRALPSRSRSMATAPSPRGSATCGLLR